MTKSLEELEQLTVEQLKGIAVGLGADPKANIRKPELVQLVYDIQQPEPSADENADTPPADEPNKPINTEAELEGKLAAIAEHFGGTDTVPVDEGEDGVVIYAVMDELTDEEKARGTFLELEEQMLTFDPDAPPSLDVNEPKEEEAQPAIEEAKLETPELADEEGFAEIERGLKPLYNLGLKYTVDGSVIKFRVGSKTITTTLNQPPHRVVNTAKQLCNFK